MDQTPEGGEDLQPQDLSTSSGVSRAMDLTRRSEGGTLKNPGWFQSSGPPAGPAFSEPGSGEHVQPDQSFSRTTVTLSYVSRSHVFSAQDPSLRPAPDKVVLDGRYSLGQHFLEQAEEPVDLATCHPELHQGVLCLTQELNGGGVSGDLEKGPAEENLEGSPSWRKSQDGQMDSQSSSGVCVGSSPETLDEGGPDVVFLTSKERVVDYVSPPSATSLDDVFDLPQTSSSPSTDNPGGSVMVSSDTCASKSSSDLNTDHKPLMSNEAIELIDLTGEDPAAVPHVNGTTSTRQRTSGERRRLPARSGRGTRLEAIVMNINSGRYRLSGSIHANGKMGGESTATPRGPRRGRAPEADAQKGTKRRRRARAAFSAKRVKTKSGTGTKTTNSELCKDSTSDSENLSISQTSPKSLQCSPSDARKRSQKELQTLSPAKSPRRQSSRSSPRSAVSEKEAGLRTVGFSPARSPPPSAMSSKSPKKTGGKAKVANRKAAKTKASHSRKRRRRKNGQHSSSAMFAPKEPEIRLKYVNYREERRDLRTDSFHPFVRLESASSLCTVYNYPEDVRTQHRQAPPRSGSFAPAVVPSTSSLQLGRASTGRQHQRPLVCCLCGRSANAMDLGDLHGPYHPEGPPQHFAKTLPGTSDLKRDPSSDSDSSLFGPRSRSGRNKRAVPPGSWSFRSGAPPTQTGLLENHRRGDSGGEAAKRTRSSPSGPDEEDWYSPPLVPMESREYWVHEDCAVWTTGVFLVKGKVYGLEEAVKASQETVCSECEDPGASLGCFCKGCGNIYHYSCALHAECTLLQENFSIRCKKHKNKTMKSLPGKRGGER